MARYYNKVTGAIIDSPCTISGGDWLAETEMRMDDETVTEAEVIATQLHDEEMNHDEANADGQAKGLSKKEIMQELNAFGIEFDPKATKQELYELMMKGN